MRHRLLIVWPSLASGIPRILNFHLMDACFFYAVMEMWPRDSVHPFLILLCKRCECFRESIEGVKNIGSGYVGDEVHFYTRKTKWHYLKYYYLSSV